MAKYVEFKSSLPLAKHIILPHIELRNLTTHKFFDMANLKKEYSNGVITVVWQPTKCTHAGVCVHTLPKVYNPKAKPWIAIENASSEALRNQVNKCPSGALSFYENKE